LGSSSTLAPGLSNFPDTAALGWGRKIEKRKEEEGVNEMAKRMEGMSFFYEDEIGQAKWQGVSSFFSTWRGGAVSARWANADP
jgi:hypothetical protein